MIFWLQCQSEEVLMMIIKSIFNSYGGDLTWRIVGAGQKLSVDDGNGFRFHSVNQMGAVDVQQTHVGRECGDGIDTSGAVVATRVAAPVAARRHGGFAVVLVGEILLLLVLRFVVGIGRVVARLGDDGANHFRKGRKADHPRIWKNVRVGNQLANQLLENNFHTPLLAFVLRFGRWEFVERTTEFIGGGLTFQSRHLNQF